jgi:hypothetical protein
LAFLVAVEGPPYLILHRSHIAFLSPVHVYGDFIGQRFLEHFPLSVRLLYKAIHHFPEFFTGLQAKVNKILKNKRSFCKKKKTKERKHR